MRIELRSVYIAIDGEEFDSEESCKRHELILFLTKEFAELSCVDEYYAEPIAKTVIDHFSRIKELVEGGIIADES